MNLQIAFVMHMVTVTITGEGYKGLLVQARRKDGRSEDPIGTFTTFPDYLRTLECRTGAGADSVTQASDIMKNSDTNFTWTAPHSSVGDIEFLYVAQFCQKATFDFHSV